MKRAGTCRTCEAFDDRPLALERDLPALAALSSAHGSSRSGDGLCLTRDRFVPSSATCADHREAAVEVGHG